MQSGTGTLLPPFKDIVTATITGGIAAVYRPSRGGEEAVMKQPGGRQEAGSGRYKALICSRKRITGEMIFSGNEVFPGTTSLLLCLKNHRNNGNQGCKNLQKPVKTGQNGQLIWRGRGTPVYCPETTRFFKPKQFLWLNKWE
ncbi:hypothetical protein EG028_05115 [Chitinophaga barathri]|uniref:Uncharacterized protein n=1 Tax=Chitinophaga barathri TaxID=1647451 RepID=A0A3N4MKG2_9BACT|nr:hypothetical protein EG028_05115 [Chitinophaga barathri]